MTFKNLRLLFFGCISFFRHSFLFQEKDQGWVQYKSEKMKCTFSFLLGILFFSATSFAQIQLGGGLAYGGGISKLGLNVRGTYEINEKFLAAPGATFFFKDKALSDVSVSYFSIDLDAQYRLIAIGDNVQVYPVGGINIFNVGINGPTAGIRIREDGLKVGLNLGLGAQVATLSNWNYFGEFKFTVGGIDQSTITAGVLYGF